MTKNQNVLSSRVLHIKNILRRLHKFYKYFDASCGFKRMQYPADTSSPIPKIISLKKRLMSDSAVPHSRCFSFSWSHIGVCDISLTAASLERIITSDEREAAGIDEIFRREPHVCVETFVRSNLEIRKKREKKAESTTWLELSPMDCFPSFSGSVWDWDSKCSDISLAKI